MSFPEIRAEVAWEVDPLTRPGALDWVRIDTTCGMRSLSTSRGVRLKTGDIETGSARAVFDNRTRDLDPSYASSTWAPDVTLRKRVRFRVDPGSGLVDIFTGFIEALPLTWDLSASDGEVSMEVIDLLGLLAEKELPPSVLHQTIVDLAPEAYWPLTESTGSNFQDVIGVQHGTTNRPIVATAEVVPFDPRPCIDFKRPDDNDQFGMRARVYPIAPPSTLTLSVWLRATGNYAKPTLLMFKPRHTLAAYLSVGTFATSLFVNAYDGSTSAQCVTENGSVAPLDGRPHHLAVTINGSTGELVFYWDGGSVPVYTTGGGAGSLAALDLGDLVAAVDTLDMGWGTTTSSSEVNNAGAVGHVAYWDSVLTAAQILSIYEAGVDAWGGDFTGARLERVLDVLGIDVDDRDIATGTVTCGPTLLGGNALDYIRRIAATEGGGIFVSGDGKITFTEEPANDPTPLDVIGDAGCPTSQITVGYSLDRMVNTATVTRENGAGQTYEDTTAVDGFGPRSVSLDTLHATPDAALSRAAEIVIRNKDLKVRVSDLTLESIRSDVPAAVSLDTEIGDPYTVSYDPAGPGGVETALVRVERIEHQFDADRSWRTRFGVDEQTVLPDFQLDTAGAGVDQSVLAS